MSASEDGTGLYLELSATAIAMYRHVSDGEKDHFHLMLTFAEVPEEVCDCHISRAHIRYAENESNVTHDEDPSRRHYIVVTAERDKLQLQFGFDHYAAASIAICLYTAVQRPPNISDLFNGEARMWRKHNTVVPHHLLLDKEFDNKICTIESEVNHVTGAVVVKNPRGDECEIPIALLSRGEYDQIIRINLQGVSKHVMVNRSSFELAGVPFILGIIALIRDAIGHQTTEDTEIVITPGITHVIQLNTCTFAGGRRDTMHSRHFESRVRGHARCCDR